MTEQPTDRATTDLSRRTLGGLQWTYIGSAVGAVLNIAMAAVLARLLTPAAFGLVALAGAFLRFVEYFSRAGIVQALIQKESLSRDDVRAGFTLSASLGIVFAASAALLAPLAGNVAQDPDVTPVVQWLALGLLIHGLGAPSVALLRRKLRFKPLALINIAAYLIGYAGVGLVLALLGAGVYALVAALLVQSLARSLGAYAMVRHPLRPTRERAAYRAVLAFGTRVSVVSFFEFLQTNLDTLAVGRWAGSTQLGLYNRAKLLADLPAYHLANGLSEVLFPSFSAIQSDHRRLRDGYLSALGMTAAIILPLNAGMAVASRDIVLVILGPQWAGAAEVMPWLLLASSLAMTGRFAGIVAEAQAALNAKIVVAASSTVTLGALLLIARDRSLPFYGMALAVAALVSHLGYALIIRRTLGTTLWRLLAPIGPASIGAAVVAGVIAIARTAVSLASVSFPTTGLLAIEVLSGAFALSILFRFGPLRPFRADLATRLANTGLLATNKGLLRRLLRGLVGPPSGEMTREDGGHG